MALLTGAIVAVGDSITLGTGASFAWPSAVATALSLTAHNVAHGGAGWGAGSNLTTAAASEVDTAYVAASPQPFLLLFAGRNDISSIHTSKTGAQTYALFETYIAARLTAGWSRHRIVVCTALAGTDCAPAETAAYNALLVTGVATYGYQIVRLDLDPDIGGSSAYLNTTYFNVDQIHLADAGQQRVADLVAAVKLQRQTVSWT